MPKRKKDEIKLEVDKELLIKLIEKIERMERAINSANERISRTLKESKLRKMGLGEEIFNGQSPDIDIPLAGEMALDERDIRFVVGIVTGRNFSPEKFKGFEEELKDLMIKYRVSQVTASILKNL